MSTEVLLDPKGVQAICNVIEREQDRILLKLRNAGPLMRPHLARMLAETRVALAAIEAPALAVKLFQDGGERTYECGPLSCGYDGDQYCSNCGYAAGEQPVQSVG